MIIQKKTMGWLPKASAYDEVANANAKRKASNESFMSNQTSFSSSFTSIQTSFVTESGNLASQAAAARLGITLNKSA